MKEAERALFLLFISVEFWQEKRESVDGWMEREGVRRRRARDASARSRPPQSRDHECPKPLLDCPPKEILILRERILFSWHHLEPTSLLLSLEV